MRQKRHAVTAGSVAALAAAAALLSTPARAIDLDAGDYTALPAGTTLGLLYAQHASRDELYAHGRQLPLEGRLVSDVGILRGVHFMELAGHIVNPQFLLPFGRLRGQGSLDSLGSNSGVGDLILAAAMFGSKPGDKTQYAVMPYLWLPTGQYDRDDPLSLGENRWKFALQGGYSTPLSEKLTFDLMGDVTFFGKNDDASDGAGGRTTLRQKPLFDVQAHLRWHLDGATDLRLQLAHSFGGETKLGGAWQDNRSATTRMKLGIGHFFGQSTQLLVLFNRDLDVREGFKIDKGVQLRLLQVF
jgi:hypothetical protein